MFNFSKRSPKFACLWSGILLAWGFFSSFVLADSVYDAHTQVELIAETESIHSGETFFAGIHFKMDPEWHVYWKNPGDSGMAPQIKWDVAPEITAGALLWPYPQKIEQLPLATYGYEDEVLLMAPFQVAENLSTANSVKLRAKVAWLACKVECLPGKAEVEITLPVSSQKPLLHSTHANLFAQTRKKHPRELSSGGIDVEKKENHVSLFWSTNGELGTDLREVYFFAEDSELTQHAAQQILKKSSEGFELQIPLAVNHPKESRRLDGVLVARENDRVQAWEIHTPMKLTVPTHAVAVSSSVKIGVIMGFAFLGGLLLNLMPCVLPVLSIKILGFLNAPQKNSKDFLKKGIFFTTGVLVSFWVLAATLILLQSAGKQIGWGFQLQSPSFVAILSVLFFIFAFNLFGFFEIGTSLTGTGQSWIESGGWQGSFASGVLAVVVATPCTAPFMGTALAFALSQPPLIAMAVFTALGFGLSAPYLVLCFYPKWLRFLPKPGPWMIRFKKILGILMFLAALWLLWILSLQTGVVKKWMPTSFASAQNQIVWEAYSDKRLEELRAQGQPVFIDFTAAWCLTCQWNKKTALSHSTVIKIFKEKGITALKADWTLQDPVVTQALQRYGRSSIPFYVFYPARSLTPIFLPELLTPERLVQDLS